MSSLVFLKLGGSLITEKEKTSKARVDVIARLAREIAAARSKLPDMRLLVGHGSGSFGHVPAKKYDTRAGVKNAGQWAGFAEVWHQAAALNHIVTEAFRMAGWSPVVFPPSATITAFDGQIKTWNIQPIELSLEADLLPIIYGDVAFDSVRGGTILSTEDLFAYLAEQLHPSRILLAGDEEGVYQDYPARQKLINEITPATFTRLSASVGKAASTDVTGGMEGKVQSMLELVKRNPDCQVRVLSGLKPGTIQEALSGQPLGTLIRSDSASSSID